MVDYASGIKLHVKKCTSISLSLMQCQVIDLPSYGRSMAKYSHCHSIIYHEGSFVFYSLRVYRIDLAPNTKLRKLRSNLTESSVTGDQYTEKLRTQ